MLIVLISICLTVPWMFIALLIYTSGLTWKTSEVSALLERRPDTGTLQAGVILRLLDHSSHDKLAQFDFTRLFVQKMLPFLFREAQRLTRLAGDWKALFLFSVFCTLYGFVWMKAQIKANKEDLRSLIGAELLILRQAER